MSIEATIPSPRVALIFEEPPAKDHLQEALRDAHIDVSSECRAGDLDSLTLDDADVILVILDEGTEPYLDDVNKLVSNAGLPVVFDDCSVSRDLSGTDRNRWARHLFAKLTGTDDTCPPLPEGMTLTRDLEEAR